MAAGTVAVLEHDILGHLVSGYGTWRRVIDSITDSTRVDSHTVVLIIHSRVFDRDAVGRPDIECICVMTKAPSIPGGGINGDIRKFLPQH